MSIDIATLIDRDPKIGGGRPKIAGTGLKVRTIAVWSNQGFSPEQIAAKYDHVSLAQVHAALAYYFVNRAEIDEDLALDEQIAERMRSKHEIPSPG